MIGNSTGLNYDSCAYKKQVDESTSPLIYQMYEGKFENCNKCKYDQFWRVYDLVNVESELLNITRPNTKCELQKYNPTCKKSKNCISTFDPSLPVVFAPEVCPIVQTNIPKLTHPGYVLNESNVLIKCEPPY